MRRSDRIKTKSLKAELEDSAQIKYKMMKHISQTKSESEGASIGVQSAAEVAGTTNEEDSRTSHQVGDNPISQRRKRRVKEIAQDFSSESGQDETHLRSEQEEEFPERGVLSSEGQWSHYPTLCASLPGREKQLQLLLALFGEVRSMKIHLVYVSIITLGNFISSVSLSHLSCYTCVWAHGDWKDTDTADHSEDPRG